jgi:acetylornithine deacetylase/succinyl-diaminopimelate desuccinylase-like protein
MARIVELLEIEYAGMLRKRRHPLLGHPTVNVGTIAGGRQPNIVPDGCVIGIDRRTIPGESDTAVRAEIERLLRRRRLHAHFVNVRMGVCPALETSSSLPLVRDLLRAVGQRRAAGVAYFCDAAVLASGGTPSVVFGPGDIAYAHTRDEWIEISQLDAGVRKLDRFFQMLP